MLFLLYDSSIKTTRPSKTRSSPTRSWLICHHKLSLAGPNTLRERGREGRYRRSQGLGRHGCSSVPVPVRALQCGGSRGVAQEGGSVAVLEGGGVGQVVQVDCVRHAPGPAGFGRSGPARPTLAAGCAEPPPGRRAGPCVRLGFVEGSGQGEESGVLGLRVAGAAPRRWPAGRSRRPGGRRTPGRRWPAR